MKHIVRKKTKKIRDKISAPALEKRSLAIFRNFCAAFKSKMSAFRHVMIYMSVQSEVKTKLFFKLFSDNKSKIYVPCVCNNEITPMLMGKNMACKPAAFGIPEPVKKIRIKTLKSLNLIIVPGIAFDRHGNRIGFGKGFFDKFLRQLPAKTLKIALAFSSQIVKKTHAKKHDVKMDYIITEKEIIIA
jgi:5-formyltetrahydrofolate cyclo-ligase